MKSKHVKAISFWLIAVILVLIIWSVSSPTKAVQTCMIRNFHMGLACKTKRVVKENDLPLFNGKDGWMMSHHLYETKETYIDGPTGQKISSYTVYHFAIFYYAVPFYNAA